MACLECFRRATCNKPKNYLVTNLNCIKINEMKSEKT